MRNLFIKYLQNKTLWHYTTKNLRCIGYICTLCRRNYEEVKEFKKKTKSTNKLWIEAQILMRNIIYCLLPWICVVLKISVQIAIQCHFIYFLQSSGIPWKKKSLFCIWIDLLNVSINFMKILSLLHVPIVLNEMKTKERKRWVIWTFF